MRRIHTLLVVASLAWAVLPATAHGQAVPGDYIELDVTYRGHTPWISSAVVNLAIEPVGDELTMRLSDGTRTAVASHPSPSGALADTPFDLTDVAPIRTDVPFTVALDGYGEASIEAAELSFGSPAGTVTGKGPAGTDLDVTLDSGEQSLSRTVTTGEDGSFTADFTDEFDGTWEFGATIATTVESSTSSGVSVDVIVTRRLPTADLQDFLLEPGTVPASAGRIGVVDDLTPGAPATVFGHAATVTERSVVRPLPDGQATVQHLGQTVTLRPVADLAVEAYDFETDVATGTAPAGAEVRVAATATFGDEVVATATAGEDGAWSADLAAEGLDATTVVLIDASVIGEDLARHHAQRIFGEPEELVGGAVAVLHAATDRLELHLPGDASATWDVAARTPDATGRVTATGAQLAAGISADEFDPAIDVTAGIDLTARSGSVAVVIRVPELTWQITADGDIEGRTDPGVSLTVVDDVPIVGLEAGEVTSGEDGNFSFDTDAPAAAGRHSALFAVVDDPESTNLTLVADEQRVVAREHVVGAEGGRAPGQGFGLGAPPAEVAAMLNGFELPVSWEMDAHVAAGGAEDLTVQLPPPTPTDAVDGLVAAGPYVVRVRENGAAVERPSVAMELLVPLLGFESAGGAPNVAVARRVEDRWTPLEAGRVTYCLDASSALPTGCDRFPLPYALVDDATAGDYALVQLASDQPPTVERISGPGRITTAVQLSRQTFAAGGPDAIVVAAAETFPDALAAAPLAAAADGPVLLNPRDRLDDDVATELQRLGTATVFLMGGTAAQSREVEQAIAALDTVDEVVRVAGPDRFGTAAAAATRAVELWRAGGDDTAGTRPLVALGTHPEPGRAFPDALAAGPLAGASHQPILLVAPDTVPSATSAALDELGATRVSVVGGTAAIPESTAGQLERPVDRLSGPDRYATSARLADAALAAGASASRVLVATGLTFPDGLAAGPAAVARGGVVLLVDGASLAASEPTAAWLDRHRDVLSTVSLIGGRAAISDEVMVQIRARVGAD